MKKAIGLILIACMLSVSALGAYAATDGGDPISNVLSKFTDVNSSSWFLENVALLVDEKIIDGYGDKTFKPNESVTKAQFIKMIVTSLGYKDIIPNTKGYWAVPYISKAQEIGVLDKYVGQTPESFDVKIPREDMAIILKRAMSKEIFVSNIDTYKAIIKDVEKIDAVHLESVLKVYSKGILTGYEDGTFRPENGLTRAEASVVIIRMLYESKRAFVDTLQNETEIARLKAYAKAGDGTYSSLPNATTGGSLDFGAYATYDIGTLKDACKLANEFLVTNKDKYKVKDTQFYTNKDLAYSTVKGLLRVRGTIDGVDQEIEYGWLKDGKFVLLNVIELK